jgi:dihydrofolate reductase
MPVVRATSAVSLDGFSAGTDPGVEFPLGRSGKRLHAHVRSRENIIDAFESVGAVVIGHRMFVCGEGPWGDENPWGRPVFVVTHTPRPTLEWQGVPAFYFVSDGIESALDQAKAVAGARNVLINGGTNLTQQYINAGLVDELHLTLVPIFLGSGVRYLDGMDDSISLETIGVHQKPDVTHLIYRLTYPGMARP